MTSTAGIQVSFPSELAFALKMRERDLAREVLCLSLIKLYELGRISSGLAGKMLNMTRVEFLDLAGHYQVSILGNPEKEQLSSDFENA